MKLVDVVANIIVWIVKFMVVPAVLIAFFGVLLNQIFIDNHIPLVTWLYALGVLTIIVTVLGMIFWAFDHKYNL